MNFHRTLSGTGPRVMVWGFRLTRQSSLFNLSDAATWNEISKEKRAIEAVWKPKVREAAKWKGPADPSKKMFCLAMFPYPSGNLHMGHARVYTISDTVAHFYRMNGKYVIHPMGWDAFGLPAENAAQIHGVDPSEWTVKNVAKMRQQLDSLGLCLDWDREVNTSTPEYYKATQQIFLELFKHGLVYRDKGLVNWDPVDETVLADEQVDKNGRSWRSGAKVEKRELVQWYIRTTKFSKQLLDGLESPALLQGWRDVVTMQKNWIGKCDGYLIDVSTNCGTTLKTWTRHPEEPGLFVAVRKDHPLSQRPRADQPFPEGALMLEATAAHPLHGNHLPLITLDREELTQDNSVYLGVASCDDDSELARALGLPNQPPCAMTLDEAVKLLKEKGVGQGDLVSHHLRDWLISRQRRWGTPIPLISCSGCGPQPMPSEQLPLMVPKPGTNLEQWKKTTCPKCGGPAERETDTMDTFVDSSWYMARFIDPHNSERPFDPQQVKPYMPVDLYIGGKEHALLHLYYARFIGHFMHSIGWLDQPEPFARLLMQGMVMGKSYCVKKTGKYLRPDQVDTSGKQPVELETGAPVMVNWEKMSKSKFNGIEPEEVLEELGCDATRLLLLADAAPTSSRKWSKDTYSGIIGWQRRICKTVKQFVNHRKTQQGAPPENLKEQLLKEEQRLWQSRNYFLSKTTFNYKISQQLHASIMAMQKLTNSLRETPADLTGFSEQFERTLALQLVMIAPMAPHFASELWAAFASAGQMKSTDFQWNLSVLEQRWPKLDADFQLNLTLYLNNNEVAKMKVRQDECLTIQSDEVIKHALQREDFKTRLGSRKILGVLLDRIPEYALNAYIRSERPEEDQTKKSSTLKKIRHAKRESA